MGVGEKNIWTAVHTLVTNRTKLRSAINERGAHGPYSSTVVMPSLTVNYPRAPHVLDSQEYEASIIAFASAVCFPLHIDLCPPSPMLKLSVIWGF